MNYFLRDDLSCLGKTGATKASSSAQAMPLTAYTTAMNAANSINVRPKSPFNSDENPETTASRITIKKYACCSLVRWFLPLFHSARNCLNNEYIILL